MNVQGNPIKNLPISAKSTGTCLTLKFLIIAPKTQPMASSSTNSSTNSSNLNYRSRKIKVIRSPSSANAKDMSLSSFATKLKSAEAYAAMLTEPKLAHFYKCMGHNCSYTTDSLTLYSQHYVQHYEDNMITHNYDKCAYCYTSVSNWIDMKTHLEEKHSHCRYQCGYCFYRAIVPSYVQQHQVIFSYYVITTILLKEKE